MNEVKKKKETKMNKLLKNKMVNDGLGFMVRGLVNAAFIMTGIVLANLVMWIVAR